MLSFTAVGMKYNGNHRFSENDFITVQKEGDNPKDGNAVKILVNYKHKAYVTRKDTKKILKFIDEGITTAKFIKHFKASAVLEMYDETVCEKGCDCVNCEDKK